MALYKLLPYVWACAMNITGIELGCGYFFREEKKQRKHKGKFDKLLKKEMEGLDGKNMRITEPEYDHRRGGETSKNGAKGNG